MGIFHYDSGVMRALNKFTDCMLLSLLFLICCIPVFTIGTAATALYYTVYKVLRKDRGYIFRDYLAAFRDNFKQTAPVWLLVLLSGTVLWADWNIMCQYVKDETLFSILTVVFYMGMFLLLSWVSYLFPYMARFENTRKHCMKNAILLAVVHLPMTIVLLALVIIAVFLFYMMPLLIFFLPSVHALLQSFILERIFRKYMTEEERTREEELDQV